MRKKRKTKGLCAKCGVKVDAFKSNGDPYFNCAKCTDLINTKAREKRVEEVTGHDIPHPITTTKQRYLIKGTNNVGEICPCPGDDPIVLRFTDKGLRVFHRHEVKLTDLPITKGRDRPQIQQKTIKNLTKIYQYVKNNEPVALLQITKKLGKNSRYLAMNAGSKYMVNLEELGIVECMKEGRSIYLMLTELGIKDGVKIIERLG